MLTPGTLQPLSAGLTLHLQATEVRFWVPGIALASRERKKLILVQNEDKPQQAAVESRAGNGSD